MTNLKKIEFVPSGGAKRSEIELFWGGIGIIQINITKIDLTKSNQSNKSQIPIIAKLHESDIDKFEFEF